MMDYTNKFLRYMLRRISTRATLYTEMVTANTIVHCPPSELPRFLELPDGECQPTVLQVGGADPDLLRRAAAISAPWGYDAINLNCGCPSDRVAGKGAFGATLMKDPELVAACCAALAEGAPGIPITVKCRIGVIDDRTRAAEIDDETVYVGRRRTLEPNKTEQMCPRRALETPWTRPTLSVLRVTIEPSCLRSQAELHRFVSIVSTRGGVSHFVVHARRAVLGGLSPHQNRVVPPLRYNLVHRLAADFPELRFSINGGIAAAIRAHHISARGSRTLVTLAACD